LQVFASAALKIRKIPQTGYFILQPVSLDLLLKNIKCLSPLTVNLYPVSKKRGLNQTVKANPRMSIAGI
jgi:hypothetical protein